MSNQNRIEQNRTSNKIKVKCFWTDCACVFVVAVIPFKTMIWRKKKNSLDKTDCVCVRKYHYSEYILFFFRNLIRSAIIFAIIFFLLLSFNSIVVTKWAEKKHTTMALSAIINDTHTRAQQQLRQTLTNSIWLISFQWKSN